MSKTTPKIIIIITSLVLIGYFVLTLLNYMQMAGTGGPSQEEIDEKFKAELQENLIEQDYMQFEFTVGMFDNIDTRHGNSVLPYDLVLNSRDHYLVSMIRENQTIKIEHLSTEYQYHDYDDEKNYTETYTDQIYYIQITDDNVSYYYPDENGNYDVKIFDDANFAKELSALLFPDDISILVRGNSVPLYPEKNEGKIETEYYIHYDGITQPFFTPFAVLSGDDPQSLNGPSDYGYYLIEYIDDVIVSPDLLKLRLDFGDMEQFFTYAYEIWNDKPYMNDLIENGYPYRQFFTLYFYYDFDAPIEFEIPAVQTQCKQI